MKKRIIHIALGKANPNRLNGVNKVVNSLVSAQVNNGFKAEFWGITHNPVHNYPSRNYATYLFKDSRLKFKIDLKLKEAIRQLKGENAVVHLHGGFIPQLYAVARLLKKNKVPFFFTPHGAYNLQALKKSKWRKWFYIQLFERSVVEWAAGVQLLGISEKYGTEKYFSAQWYCIPNGQNCNKQLVANTASENQITIGFLGRIDIHTKGLDLLLAGLREAKPYLNIVLQVIGSGGEMEAFKKSVAAHGLEDSVEFKGALFGDEKMKTISKWDALCLVSRNEGLPGVVLEAASVGVPSIITEATNMGDFLRKYQSGWVLKKAEPTALFSAFQQLGKVKETGAHKSYKNAALKMIEQEFDWNHISNQLTQVYAKVS